MVIDIYTSYDIIVLNKQTSFLNNNRRSVNENVVEALSIWGSMGAEKFFRLQIAGIQKGVLFGIQVVYDEVVFFEPALPVDAKSGLAGEGTLSDCREIIFL